MRLSSLTASAVFAAALLGIVPAQAEEAALMVKLGRISVSHSSQDLDGAKRDVDDSRRTYALAYEQRTNDGVAYGGEWITYKNRWNGPGNASGEFNSNVLLFTLKKYMPPLQGGQIYPYVGAGAGVVHASASGLNYDPSLGLALQLDGGVEVRWQSVGLYTEVRALYAHPGTLWGNQSDSSGIGLFAGLSIIF